MANSSATQPTGLHRGHVLGTGVALAMVIAIFAPKGIAPLLAVVAIGLLVVHFKQGHRWPPMSRVLLVPIGLMILWGALSSTWSISNHDSLRILPGLTGTMIAGIILVSIAADLRPNEREVVQRWLALAIGAGFLIMAFEYLTSLQITRFLREVVVNETIKLHHTYPNYLNGGFTLGVLLAIPSLAVVWRRTSTVLAVILAILILGAVFVAAKISMQVAITAGALTVALGLVSEKWMSRIVVALLVVGVLAAPAVPKLLPDVKVAATEWKELPDSFFTRLFVWQSTASHIAEKPMIGSGLNSARALYGDSDSVVAFHIPRPWGGKRILQPIPLHPHNGVLQVWLELGVVGALILIALLVSTFRQAAELRGTGPYRVGAAATFVAAVTIFCLSYGSWQSWWLSTLWLTAATAISVLHGEDVTDDPQLSSPR